LMNDVYHNIVQISAWYTFENFKDIKI